MHGLIKLLKEEHEKQGTTDSDYLAMMEVSAERVRERLEKKWEDALQELRFKSTQEEVASKSWSSQEKRKKEQSARNATGSPVIMHQWQEK